MIEERIIHSKNATPQYGLHLSKPGEQIAIGQPLPPALAAKTN